jgi:porin
MRKAIETIRAPRKGKTSVSAHFPIGAGTVFFAAVQAVGVGGLCAHDFTDWFSVDATAAAIAMHQRVSGDPGTAGASRVTAPLQLEFSVHPNECNEFFSKVAFADGEGLAGTGTWSLAPWGGDHESDVKDVNGRGRDFLLTAWYRYSRDFGDWSLSATGGIIDSVDFLGGNAFAEDEYSQFCNEVFVCNGSHGLPSYDFGGVLEARFGDWTFTGLAMSIGENDDGDEFFFWGLQAARGYETGSGKGNVRLLFVGTDAEFLDPAGVSKESLFGVSISADQEFGDVFGGFLRLGWQKDDAAIGYETFFSGGLNIDGSAWGRENDNIGLACAWLGDGNSGINHTNVFEAYYRCEINEHLAVSADVQYMSDTMENGAPSPAGWIFGTRLVFGF